MSDNSGCTTTTETRNKELSQIRVIRTQEYKKRRQNMKYNEERKEKISHNGILLVDSSRMVEIKKIAVGGLTDTSYVSIQQVKIRLHDICRYIL